MSVFGVTTEEAGKCLAFPDACDTILPIVGKVPVPYLNVGECSDMTGCSDVEIGGSAVICKDDKCSSSSGDELGTIGGVKSGKNLKKVVISEGCSDVCAGGDDVSRMTSACKSNKGNAMGKQVPPSQSGVKVGS